MSKQTYLRWVSERLDNHTEWNVAVLHQLEVVEDPLGGRAHETSVTVEKSVINHGLLPNVDWLLHNLLGLCHWLRLVGRLWSWHHLLLLGVRLLLSKLLLRLVAELKRHLVSK